MTTSQFEILCKRHFEFLETEFGFRGGNTKTEYGGYLHTKRYFGSPLIIDVKYDGLEEYSEIRLHQRGLFDDEIIGMELISYLVKRRRSVPWRRNGNSIDDEFAALATHLLEGARDWLANQRVD